MSVSESRVPSRVSLAPLGLLSPWPLLLQGPSSENLRRGRLLRSGSVVVAGGPCWWGVLGCSWLGCWAGQFCWLALPLAFSHPPLYGYPQLPEVPGGGSARIGTSLLMTCPPAVAPLWTAAPLGWVRALTRWRPLRWSPLCWGGSAGAVITLPHTLIRLMRASENTASRSLCHKQREWEMHLLENYYCTSKGVFTALWCGFGSISQYSSMAIA